MICKVFSVFCEASSLCYVFFVSLCYVLFSRVRHLAFGPAAGPPGPLRALRARGATVIAQNGLRGEGGTSPPRNNGVMFPLP